MKAIKILSVGCVIATALLLQSCAKNLEKRIPEQMDLTNYSQVQIFNAIVGGSGRSVTAEAAVLSGSQVLNGATFPTTAYSFSLPSGSRTFTLRDTAAAAAPFPLTFSENFQSNKYYTIFAYDTSTSPKQLTVETHIEVPTDTTARVRLARFTYSTSANTAIDVYSVKRNENIFSNVMNTEVTNFIPFATLRSDTLIVRNAGTTVSLGQLNGFNPTQKRSYTLVYHGGVSRKLTAFANR